MLKYGSCTIRGVAGARNTAGEPCCAFDGIAKLLSEMMTIRRRVQKPAIFLLSASPGTPSKKLLLNLFAKTMLNRHLLFRRRFHWKCAAHETICKIKSNVCDRKPECFRAARNSPAQSRALFLDFSDTRPSPVILLDSGYSSCGAPLSLWERSRRDLMQHRRELSPFL